MTERIKDEALGFDRNADAYEAARPSYPTEAVAHIVGQGGIGPARDVTEPYDRPRGGLLAFAGRAGIGKTTLLAEVRRRATAKGCTCPPEFPICNCGNEPNKFHGHGEVVTPNG